MPSRELPIHPIVREDWAEDAVWYAAASPPPTAGPSVRICLATTTARIGTTAEPMRQCRPFRTIFHSPDRFGAACGGTLVPLKACSCGGDAGGQGGGAGGGGATASAVGASVV